VQSTLFLEEELPRYVADTAAVRDRLQDMLAKMQAAASWPWKASTVATYRETLWPSLLSKLPDDAEAARLRREIEAEIARLDSVD
jgi:hypothetical protein